MELCPRNGGEGHLLGTDGPQLHIGHIAAALGCFGGRIRHHEAVVPIQLEKMAGITNGELLAETGQGVVLPHYLQQHCAFLVTKGDVPVGGGACIVAAVKAMRGNILNHGGVLLIGEANFSPLYPSHRQKATLRPVAAAWYTARKKRR